MRKHGIAMTRQRTIYENNEVEQSEGEHNFLSLSSCISLSFFLCTLVFMGFIIYAIFKYNTDEVRVACPDLMIFIIIRTVVGLILLASLATFFHCSFTGDDTYNNSYTPSVILTGSLVYFLSFCIAGGLIVSQSMLNNDSCTSILHDETLNIPILGVLGWVYVAIDGLFTIFFAYFFIVNICMRSEQENTNMNGENERMLREDGV